MKTTLIAVACLLSLASTAIGQKKQLTAKSTPATPALEGKVRKVWEDFKNKNKEALGAALAEGFAKSRKAAAGLATRKPKSPWWTNSISPVTH
jgi:hypothetical protein